MAAVITTLKKLGKIIYPKTKTEAVYDANNVPLDTTLSALKQDLTTVGNKILNISKQIGVNQNATFTIKSNGTYFVVNNDWESHSVWCISRDYYGTRITKLINGTGAGYITTEINSNIVKFNYLPSSGVSSVTLSGVGNVE